MVGSPYLSDLALDPSFLYILLSHVEYVSQILSSQYSTGKRSTECFPSTLKDL